MNFYLHLGVSIIRIINRSSFQQQHKHRKLHPYLQLQHELIGCNEPTAIIDHGGAMIMIGVFMLLSYMLQLQTRMKLTVLVLLLERILLIILKTMTIMLRVGMMMMVNIDNQELLLIIYNKY